MKPQLSRKERRFPELHNFNDMYTPPEAMKYIIPFLDKKLIYWESCYGKGHMARELADNGFKVVGNPDINCLKEEPKKWDILITNPPFKTNKVFIKRAIELGKPFAFLIRLEHLGGVEALELFRDLDFKIIIPRNRINYITPKMIAGKKVGGSPFHSIWFTYKIKLPNQINYMCIK
jgi:hypothetical protein